MGYRDWILRLPVVLVLFAAVLIGINYTVDPSQRFRISTFYPLYFDTSQQRHLNAGLARNYDYGSVVIGTSHTKNFRLADIKKELAFPRPVKLILSAGTAYEEGRLLKLALQHRRPSKVLFGLDIFAFSGSPKHKDPSFPEYLYDGSPLSALRYLFKFDTTIRSITSLARPWFVSDRRKFDFERMYETQYLDANQYGKEKMLKHGLYLPGDKDAYAFETLKKSFEINFLPLLRENRDVNVTIFFPPYSILAYQGYAEKGILSETLKFKRYLVDVLGEMGHVEIFDFQVAREKTHNLDNYRDLKHYHQRVSTWMLSQIKTGRYRLDKSNVDTVNRMLLEQTRRFRLER